MFIRCATSLLLDRSNKRQSNEMFTEKWIDRRNSRIKNVVGQLKRIALKSDSHSDFNHILMNHFKTEKKRMRPHAWKFERHSIYCRIENCVQLIDCEIRQNAPKLRILFRFNLSSIGNWSLEKETFDQLTRITWLEKRPTCAHAQRRRTINKKPFQSTFK